MSNSKHSSLAFFLIALIAIALGIFLASQQKPQTAANLELEKAIILPNPKQISGFELRDYNDQVFDNNSIKGKWSILFFGFTFCPDICPTTMNTLKQVKAQLQEQGLWQHFRVVMVSVDPDRDTTEQLKKYVPFFDPEFIGTTGNEAVINRFAKELGILYIKREKQENGNYDVDHGASLILINPEGKMAGVISPPHQVKQITQDLAEIAKHMPADQSSQQSTPNKTEPVTVAAQTEQTKTKLQTTKALTASNGWIRPSPGGATAMAGYVTLHNKSDAEIKLVGAESAQFGHLMIHATEFEDGIARMVHLESLTVPVGGSVELKPLDTHIMLMMPKQPLKIGDQVEFSLIDDKNNKYPLTLTVKNQAIED